MEDKSRYSRWSWKYAALKEAVKISFRVYFGRLCVNGEENIPSGGRLIFVANHQNALMDPLAVIVTNRYQPVYLARADLFRNPVFARILRFLKIMPVYRMRDGIESMGDNQDTFDNAASFLAEGGCIGIMPEGNHHRNKRLRPLKKGFGRIAFRAEEFKNMQAGIKIVPVGLDYGNISEFPWELVINYGKPIKVSDYIENYRRHPQAGINALKNDLAGALGSLMLDVKDEENYQEDKLLVDYGSRELAGRLKGRVRDLCDRSAIDREICTAMYEHFEQDNSMADSLRTKSARIIEIMNSNQLPPDAGVKSSKISILPASVMRIIIFPVILMGLAVHIFPITVTHYALKKVKEPEFVSSFKFALGTLLLPLNYILICVAAFIWVPIGYALMSLVLVPLSGLSAAICHGYSKRLRKRMLFSVACKNNREFEQANAKLARIICRELEPVIRAAAHRLKMPTVS